ncbi:MAG: redoxin family protein, partial [Hyphomicrobiales bacterium]|nr:redoxin family protein [Hyphomicrobiales bacterium]
MTIKVGDHLPSVSLREPSADGPKTIQSADIMKGRRIVLFAVPGAFTPTCHRNHLPGFLANEAALRAKGVDEIAVISVNDVHVMKAWEEATGAKGKIRFLADGNADFARAVGLTFDGAGGGMG